MTNVCFKTLVFIKTMLKIFRKRLQGQFLGEWGKQKRNDRLFVPFPFEIMSGLNLFRLIAGG
jgi:hypothetical protein